MGIWNSWAENTYCTLTVSREYAEICSPEPLGQVSYAMVGVIYFKQRALAFICQQMPSLCQQISDTVRFSQSDDFVALLLVTTCLVCSLHRKKDRTSPNLGKKASWQKATQITQRYKDKRCDLLCLVSSLKIWLMSCVYSEQEVILYSKHRSIKSDTKQSDVKEDEINIWNLMQQW